MAERLYRVGVQYYKIGVGAIGLVSDRQRKIDLFLSPENPALMEALDAVFFAAQGTTQRWKMSREFLSSQYTTRLKYLPQIMC